MAGAYDAAGALVKETLPGGYAQAWTRNLAGQVTATAYTQTVGGATTPVLGFTQTYDHLGRVVQATGPAGSQRYTYDDRARLSKVEDTGTEGCVTRVYGFTGDSNRTSLTSYGPDVAGGCQATTVAASSSYSYDSADRLTTSGYVYDRMGRSTTVPKVHTSNADDQLAGDLAVTYAANDMVASLQQTVSDPTSGVAQVRRQAFSLDGSDRVSTTKGFTDGVQLSEKLDHYDGESDSPAWTSTKTRPDASTAWTSSWNRFVPDLAGGLTVDVDGTGVAKLQLANLHGDIVAIATLGQAGIDSYTETDEYGQPKTSTSARYGWLGTHQRDADTVGGLTLMGARLYNPTTGRFLSIDVIARANSNDYSYPADPINSVDISGNNPLAVALGAGLGDAAIIAATAIVVGVGLLQAAYLIHQLYSIGVEYVWRLATNTWLTQGVVKVAATTYRWNVFYRGYEILYKEGGKWRTWKYGITSQQGNARLKDGVRACTRAEGIGKCRAVVRVQAIFGYYYARSWEYAMIAAYAVKNWGHCPPGQWLSCK